MWISLQNEGKENYVVNKGETFCQGLFIKYLKVDNEANDFVDRTSDY